MAKKTPFKKPDYKSLWGREAGTSTRSKKGVQVGSKARRKMRPINTQGAIVELPQSQIKKGKVQRKKVAKKRPTKKRK